MVEWWWVRLLGVMATVCNVGWQRDFEVTALVASASSVWAIEGSSNKGNEARCLKWL